jgi:hypothetical protein
MGIYDDVIVVFESVKFIVICNYILQISAQVYILYNQFDIELLILLMEYSIDTTFYGILVLSMLYYIHTLLMLGRHIYVGT